MIVVPNRFPTLTSSRICLIGEAPGREEELRSEPFCGPSGKFLAALLARAGTSREACLIANVCQHRPPDNNLAAFDWLGPEIQSGINQLEKDLITFQPNIIVPLGNASLHLCKTGNEPPKRGTLKGKPAFKYPDSVHNWRGSLFDGKYGKTLATLHPAYVLRDYAAAPLLQFDLKKAVRQSGDKTLLLPSREVLSKPSEVEILRELDIIQQNKPLIAIDIEGGIEHMSCISFATSAHRAFIVPFPNTTTVWRKLAQVLEDRTIPKVLQNALYDRFVLAYAYNIRVRNCQDDTMLKHWELYCELEKSLGVQTSIYTDEPFYKTDRKTDDLETFHRYCCKDSLVTYEINTVLDTRLKGSSLDHYRLNTALLNPLLYMELRGIRYDTDKAAKRRMEVRGKMFEHQARFNGLSGHFIRSRQQIFDSARELMGYKRAVISSYDQLVVNAKKDHVDDAIALRRLVREPNPTLATIGEIESLCGLGVNIDSSQQMQFFLYQTLGLPTQYDAKKEPPTPTVDYEAMLKLVKHVEKTAPNSSVAKLLQHAIEISSLGTRQQMLSIHADKDGRIRCGYNLVGSETGRITCYTSPTGSGYNLQTIPKYDRDLFLADDDHWMFQCDLSGADGWTVAAYCAMLGDRTMLDDYEYGLKPARILVLSLRGVSVDFTDRAALKEASKKVGADDWDYFGMKRVQHGSSYLEGPLRISNQILSDSEGKFWLPPAECKKLRDLFFFARYPGIQRWHQWTERRISERSIMTAASGQTRIFFDRKDEILPKAVAHEPQANTTYATNLAMYRLWSDGENRERKPTSPHNSGVRLRIEPLHQVHDALLGQFRKADTTWAVSKIKQWFNNPMTVAGQLINIPFEGHYGRSWGELTEGEIK